MPEINTFPLDYHTSFAPIVEHFAERAATIWLDSSQPYSKQGRFEVLGLEADTLIRAKHQTIEIIKSNTNIETVTANPFDTLRSLFKQYPEITSNDADLFCPGFLGYFSYDLGRVCEKLPDKNTPLEDFYDCYGGFYPWVLVTDHQKQTTYLSGILSPDELAQKAQWLKSQPEKKLPEFKLQSQIIPSMSYDDYTSAFNTVKEHIYAGDCYQANLTQRFYADYSGHAWNAYKILRQKNPTPFAAYINTGEYQILSCSPERFLQVNDRVVMTQPIKGTAKRHADPKIDEELGQALLNSQKDRAENIMIVDLMRNDISRNCEVGSVTVPSLCKLDSFPSVHHLTSTVLGKLGQNKTCIDLLRDCFPGGSITGTPKIRSMEIIEAVEPVRRGIYCGSIGYIGFDGRMDSNIAIRTLHCKNQRIALSAGGAIIADSTCESEYEECHTKLNAIVKALSSNGN